jgi:D-alanyl-D-alanine carboxypeptidase
LYLPGVATNGATIRQALNMTSGIPGYTDDAFMQGQAADPRKVWTPEEVIAIVAGRSPLFAAGQGWDYSNTNYTMLGLIAEQAGGAPLGELIDERIFAPLDMTGCSMPTADDTSIPAPRSHGYQFGAYWDGEGTPPPMVDVTDWNMSWGFGTGEAVCTAADLVIWAHALASGVLLDPATQAERVEWVSTGHPSLDYGLGIANLDGHIGHNGSIAGFQSQATIRESDGTAIVVLTNLSTSPDLRTPATAISNAISEALPPQ